MEVKAIILKSAIKLFIEEGFWEVSINCLIKEMDMDKKDFSSYFNSKEQLICEAIDKYFFSYFADIFKSREEDNITAKEELLRIFQRYSETESYLKNNFIVKKFNYESIICLLIRGTDNYESMTKYIIDFNEKLFQKIERVIEKGKISGEISNILDSKSIAESILKELQNSIVLWAMNQNINIKGLFETSFKHLWNNIKLGVSVYGEN